MVSVAAVADVAPAASLSVYVKESVPQKSASGVYVAARFVLTAVVAKLRVYVLQDGMLVVPFVGFTAMQTAIVSPPGVLGALSTSLPKRMMSKSGDTEASSMTVTVLLVPV